MMRMAMVEQTGRFAEDFLRQGEEHDFAVQLLDRGFRILYAPDSVLYHGRGSQSELALKNTYLSTVATAWKYFPYHYALLRTSVNALRFCRKPELEHYTLRQVFQVFIDTIRHSLKSRKPISLTTYLKWVILVRQVKSRFHSQ